MAVSYKKLWKLLIDLKTNTRSNIRQNEETPGKAYISNAKMNPLHVK